jgi:hypothetical protein
MGLSVSRKGQSRLGLDQPARFMVRNGDVLASDELVVAAVFPNGHLLKRGD